MSDIASLLKQATADHADGLSRVDAEFLLAHYLAKPRSWLYAFSDYTLNPQQVAEFQALLNRRVLGEPVAYITGRRGFWSFDLQVTPDTLIPRPETELLVDLVLARVDSEQVCRILDLGTGTGAIALAIAHERPRASVTAVDFSAAALGVAKRNALELNIRNIDLIRSDWYTELANQTYDLIVSNPPYIEVHDAHLSQGDLRFEPISALASGADGLADIRAIIAGAAKHLNPNAWLLIEHGWNQGEAVREIFALAGFAEIQTERDIAMHDRVTLGRIL